ncbi:unnamed protein product [Closterium sp. Naga37s-1]|nr:unnamed protein product [Closterium sp. Naga37s-1]
MVNPLVLRSFMGLFSDFVRAGKKMIVQVHALTVHYTTNGQVPECYDRVLQYVQAYDTPMLGLQEDLRTVAPRISKAVDAVAPIILAWEDTQKLRADVFVKPFASWPDVASAPPPWDLMSEELVSVEEYSEWALFALLTCPVEIVKGTRDAAALIQTLLHTRAIMPLFRDEVLCVHAEAQQWTVSRMGEGKMAAQSPFPLYHLSLPSPSLPTVSPSLARHTPSVQGRDSPPLAGHRASLQGRGAVCACRGAAVGCGAHGGGEEGRAITFPLCNPFFLLFPPSSSLPYRLFSTRGPSCLSSGMRCCACMQRCSSERWGAWGESAAQSPFFCFFYPSHPSLSLPPLQTLLHTRAIVPLFRDEVLCVHAEVQQWAVGRMGEGKKAAKAAARHRAQGAEEEYQRLRECCRLLGGMHACLQRMADAHRRRRFLLGHEGRRLLLLSMCVCLKSPLPPPHTNSDLVGTAGMHACLQRMADAHRRRRFLLGHEGRRLLLLSMCVCLKSPLSPPHTNSDLVGTAGMHACLQRMADAHRRRRFLLGHEGRRLLLRLADEPSLLPPMLQLVLSVLALLRAEVHWAILHTSCLAQSAPVTGPEADSVAVLIDSIGGLRGSAGRHHGPEADSVAVLVDTMFRLVSLIQTHMLAIQAHVSWQVQWGARRVRDLIALPAVRQLAMSAQLEAFFCDMSASILAAARFLCDADVACAGGGGSDGGSSMDYEERLQMHALASDQLAWHSMRSEWMQLQLLLSSPFTTVSARVLHLVSGGDDGPTSIVTETNRLYMWSRCIDQLPEAVDEQASLHLMCYYRPQMTQVFRQVLFSPHGTPSHAVGWLMVAQAFLHNLPHSLPDERPTLLPTAVQFADSLLHAIMGGVDSLLSALQSDQGLTGLHMKTLPAAAAVLLATTTQATSAHHQSLTHPSAVKHQLLQLLPGSESQPHNRAHVAGISASLHKLVGIVSAIDGLPPVRVADHAFVPREYLRERLTRHLHHRLRSAILPNGHLQRPSAFESSLTSFLLLLLLLQQHCSLDLSRTIREVLLGEAFPRRGGERAEMGEGERAGRGEEGHGEEVYEEQVLGGCRDLHPLYRPEWEREKIGGMGRGGGGRGKTGEGGVGVGAGGAWDGERGKRGGMERGGEESGWVERIGEERGWEGRGGMHGKAVSSSLDARLRKSGGWKGRWSVGSKQGKGMTLGMESGMGMGVEENILEEGLEVRESGGGGVRGVEGGLGGEGQGEASRQVEGGDGGFGWSEDGVVGGNGESFDGPSAAVIIARWYVDNVVCDCNDAGVLFSPFDATFRSTAWGGSLPSSSAAADAAAGGGEGGGGRTAGRSGGEGAGTSSSSPVKVGAAGLPPGHLTPPVASSPALVPGAAAAAGAFTPLLPFPSPNPTLATPPTSSSISSSSPSSSASTFPSSSAASPFTTASPQTAVSVSSILASSPISPILTSPNSLPPGAASAAGLVAAGAIGTDAAGGAGGAGGGRGAAGAGGEAGVGARPVIAELVADGAELAAFVRLFGFYGADELAGRVLRRVAARCGVGGGAAGAAAVAAGGAVVASGMGGAGGMAGVGGGGGEEEVGGGGGGADGTFVEVLELLMEIGGVGDGAWAMLPFLFAIMLGGESWETCVYFPEIQGFSDNANCLIRAIHVLLVGCERAGAERRELKRELLAQQRIMRGSNRNSEDYADDDEPTDLVRMAGGVAGMMRTFVQHAASFVLNSWDKGPRGAWASRVIFLDQLCLFSPHLPRSSTFPSLSPDLTLPAAFSNQAQLSATGQELPPSTDPQQSHLSQSQQLRSQLQLRLRAAEGGSGNIEQLEQQLEQLEQQRPAYASSTLLEMAQSFETPQQNAPATVAERSGGYGGHGGRGGRTPTAAAAAAAAAAASAVSFGYGAGGPGVEGEYSGEFSGEVSGEGGSPSHAPAMRCLPSTPQSLARKHGFSHHSQQQQQQQHSKAHSPSVSSQGYRRQVRSGPLISGASHEQMDVGDAAMGVVRTTSSHPRGTAAAADAGVSGAGTGATGGSGAGDAAGAAAAAGGVDGTGQTDGDWEYGADGFDQFGDGDDFSPADVFAEIGRAAAAGSGNSRGEGAWERHNQGPAATGGAGREGSVASAAAADAADAAAARRMPAARIKAAVLSALGLTGLGMGRRSGGKEDLRPAPPAFSSVSGAPGADGDAAFVYTSASAGAAGVAGGGGAGVGVRNSTGGGGWRGFSGNLKPFSPRRSNVGGHDLTGQGGGVGGERWGETGGESGVGTGAGTGGKGFDWTSLNDLQQQLWQQLQQHLDGRRASLGGKGTASASGVLSDAGTVGAAAAAGFGASGGGGGGGAAAGAGAAGAGGGSADAQAPEMSSRGQASPAVAAAAAAAAAGLVPPSLQAAARQEGDGMAALQRASSSNSRMGATTATTISTHGATQGNHLHSLEPRKRIDVVGVERLGLHELDAKVLGLKSLNIPKGKDRTEDEVFDEEVPVAKGDTVKNQGRMSNEGDAVWANLRGPVGVWPVQLLSNLTEEQQEGEGPPVLVKLLGVKPNTNLLIASHSLREWTAAESGMHIKERKTKPNEFMAAVREAQLINSKPESEKAVVPEPSGSGSGLWIILDADVSNDEQKRQQQQQQFQKLIQQLQQNSLQLLEKHEPSLQEQQEGGQQEDGRQEEEGG